MRLKEIYLFLEHNADSRINLKAELLRWFLSEIRTIGTYTDAKLPSDIAGIFIVFMSNNYIYHSLTG